MANTLKFKRGLLAGLPTAAEGEPLFTTDTKDLYIGTSTGNQRFQKYIASGATTQILRGDGSLYSFPLAISSPSNGQVLKFNGTNWVNDSDAGITGSLTTNYLPKATGATTLGNSLVFDNGTTVGVGATSFAYSPKLAISSIGQNSLAIQTTDVVQGSTGTILYLGTNATTGNTFGVIRALGTGGTAVANLVINPTGGNLLLNTTSDSGQGQVLQVNGTTLVTAGATLTTSTFSHTNVNGGINVVNSSTLASGRDAQLRLVNGSTVFGASDRTYQLINTGRSASDSDFAVFYWNGSTYLERFRVFSTGNFGIGTGTNDSAQKLQVIGSGRFSGTGFNSGSAAEVQLNNTTATTGRAFGLNSGNSGFFQIYDITAGNASRLIVDAFGNIGLNAFPSAWGSNYKVYDASYTTLANESVSFGQAILANNAYNDGTASSPTWKFKNSGTANMYIQDANNTARHTWFVSTTSGSANGSITFTRAMNLYDTGNFVLGTSDTGERLQVTGTAKITGAATFGSTIVASGLISATTEFRLNNNTFTRIAKIDASGGYAGGYNLDYSSGGVVTHAATGSIAGMRYETGGATLFFNNTSQTAGTTGTESMRIHATRNLSIGSGGDTGERLQVTGTMKVTGASTFARITAVTSSINLDFNSGILYHFGGSGDYYQFISGANYLLYNRTATGALLFGTNAVEGMRLSAAGDFGVGTGASINASAKVQFDSTTKGFLPPRMTTTQKNAIGTPAAGLVVYDTTLNKLCVYTTAWETITSL